jgi:hypothetical protein
MMKRTAFEDITNQKVDVSAAKNVRPERLYFQMCLRP